MAHQPGRAKEYRRSNENYLRPEGVFDKGHDDSGETSQE